MGWSSILKSLLTVSVLSILTVCSVESSTCIEASCPNGTCPTGSTCSSPSGCFSLIQQLQTPPPNTNLRLVEKGCVSNQNPCALEFSATLGNQQKFRYQRQCCTTEQCNKVDPTLSTLSSEANGVECPACYNDKTNTCPTTTPLKCTGEEKRCIEVTSRDSSSNNVVLYGKGCATEKACALNMTVFQTIQVKTSCTPANGSPALKSIALLPVILLLQKVLL
ncbi:protein RoBo-1-like [Mus pahari]|uniref:protein RoBo-1-like n=1 Tax=Mus pahari TaxID=10093 RepID=UPI000A3047B1|nr:protein RoBo-1-like [Mus pahari]